MDSLADREAKLKPLSEEYGSNPLVKAALRPYIHGDADFVSCLITCVKELARQNALMVMIAARAKQKAADFAPDPQAAQVKPGQHKRDDKTICGVLPLEGDRKQAALDDTVREKAKACADDTVREKLK